MYCTLSYMYMYSASVVEDIHVHMKYIVYYYERASYIHVILL